jgi:alkylated DNA repair dioxygenase AlkB
LFKYAHSQDKDESSESLRQGIPVVSFSIGDTADFVMSQTHDEVRPYFYVVMLAVA